MMQPQLSDSVASASIAVTEADKANDNSTKEKEDAEAIDFDEHEDEMAYKDYKPTKLDFGKPHPDHVVENASLAAVNPPDIRYNLAMPADIISKGLLSNLQLEAICYGCQRHLDDLPMEIEVNNHVAPVSLNEITEPSPAAASTSRSALNNISNAKIGNTDARRTRSQNMTEKKTENVTPVATLKRCGFLLGDGAGMGKGRTLAGFVLENICRGREKHVWVSVSADLYEDAKRDISDLNLSTYATNSCHLLNKFSYRKISTQLSQDENKNSSGLMFCTYRALIGTCTSNGSNRLEQLIEWCGGQEFDGLLMFDECHKAKNVSLDEHGNATKVGSSECTKTAAAVLTLQKQLPRARVVYCSATAVSEPHNLGFMNRLGLWGQGTEHPLGFNQFLASINRLGCGGMELHAMHLKSKGALLARTLSYKGCDFKEMKNVMDPTIEKVYNDSTLLWNDMYVALVNDTEKRKQLQKALKKADDLERNNHDIDRELLELRAIHDADSDDEDGDDKDVEFRRQCRRRPGELFYLV